MKLSTLYLTTLSLLPSFIAAVAIPDVASRNGTLVKRGGEVSYLANCQRSDGKSSYTASYAAWYSNVDFSQSGHDLSPMVAFLDLDRDLLTTRYATLDPQSSNSLSNEYRNWATGGDYLHWEGQQQDLYFQESAATLQTNIDGDAHSRQFTAYAGWAQRNTDGKKFNCYKDNGRQLFSWGPPGPDGSGRGITCQTIYYCV